MSKAFKAPGALLDELGVVEPGDINIEAIAEYCGATIVYERLTGCEARILGHGNRAIITVNSCSGRTRQRFSAAHELGHWMRDRGRVGFACEGATFQSGWDEDNPEHRANRYAADLLLPTKLFRPLSRGRPVIIDTLKQLGDVFGTSITATAIRLVEEGSLPSMAVCSDTSGRKWFVRSPILPESLWPHRQPGRATVAHQLLRAGTAPSKPETVDANQWIDHPRAAEYVLMEDSMMVGDRVLTLLWWKDEQQLIDLDREAEEEGEAE